MKYVFTAILLLCGILSGADKLTEKGINREVNKLFSKRKPSKKDMLDLKKAETLLANSGLSYTLFIFSGHSSTANYLQKLAHQKELW